MLPHLRSGWEVDQAILTEEDRVVVVRFGRDSDQTCMKLGTLTPSNTLYPSNLYSNINLVCRNSVDPGFLRIANALSQG